MYVFPAIDLAVYATRARRVTKEMFIAAAHSVAEQVRAADLSLGLIYPPQSNILEAEVNTAERIAEVIFTGGFAGIERPDDLHGFIESQVYTPEYRSLL